MAYEHKCLNCKTIWEAKTFEATCPACGHFNVAELASSDYENSIKNTLKKSSPLSLDVEEAEAHLAVGIAGVTKIIAKIEQQKNELKKAAKEYIAETKLFNIDMEEFNKFLKRMIEINRFDDYWIIEYPKFISLDFEDQKEYDMLIVNHRKRIKVKRPIPEWLKSYDERQRVIEIEKSD